MGPPKRGSEAGHGGGEAAASGSGGPASGSAGGGNGRVWIPKAKLRPTRKLGGESR